MKVKDLVIKKYVNDGFYLVEAPSKSVEGEILSEIIMHKSKIQEHLGVDEKELNEILTQIQ